jgi:hypothetical protein
MLAELRVAQVGRETLVESMLPASLFVLWRDPFQLVENSRCEALVDDVVRQVAEVLRLLDPILRKVEPAEAEQFAVEVIGVAIF